MKELKSLQAQERGLNIPIKVIDTYNILCSYCSDPNFFENFSAYNDNMFEYDGYRTLSELILNKTPITLAPNLQQAGFELIITLIYQRLNNLNQNIESALLDLLINYSMFQWNENVTKRFVEITMQPQFEKILSQSISLNATEINKAFLNIIASDLKLYANAGIRFLINKDLNLQQHFKDDLIRVLASSSMNSVVILEHFLEHIPSYMIEELFDKATSEPFSATKLALSKSYRLTGEKFMICMEKAVTNEKCAYKILNECYSPYFTQEVASIMIKSVIYSGTALGCLDVLELSGNKNLSYDYKTELIKAVIAKDDMGFEIMNMLENYKDDALTSEFRQLGIRKIINCSSYISLHLLRYYIDPIFDENLHNMALEKIAHYEVQETLDVFSRFGFECSYNYITGFTWIDPQNRTCEYGDLYIIKDIASNYSVAVLKEMNHKISDQTKLALINASIKRTCSAIDLLMNYEDPIFTEDLITKAQKIAILQPDYAYSFLCDKKNHENNNILVTDAIKIVIESGIKGAFKLLDHDFILEKKDLCIRAIEVASENPLLAANILLHKKKVLDLFPRMKQKILKSIINEKVEAQFDSTPVFEDSFYQNEEGIHLLHNKDRTEAIIAVLINYKDPSFTPKLKSKYSDLCLSTAKSAMVILKNFDNSQGEIQLRKGAAMVLIKSIRTAEEFFELMKLKSSCFLKSKVIKEQIALISECPYEGLKFLTKYNNSIFDPKLKIHVIQNVIQDPHTAFSLLMKYRDGKLPSEVTCLFTEDMQKFAIEQAIQLSFNSLMLLLNFSYSFFDSDMKKLAINKVIYNSTKEEKEDLIKYYCYDAPQSGIEQNLNRTNKYRLKEYSVNAVGSNYLLMLLVNFKGHELEADTKITIIKQFLNEPEAALELLQTNYRDKVFSAKLRNIAVNKVLYHEKCDMTVNDECIALKLVKSDKLWHFYKKNFTCSHENPRVQLCIKSVRCMGYTEEIKAILKDVFNSSYVSEVNTINHLIKKMLMIKDNDIKFSNYGFYNQNYRGGKSEYNPSDRDNQFYTSHGFKDEIKFDYDQVHAKGFYYQSEGIQLTGDMNLDRIYEE